MGKQRATTKTERAERRRIILNATENLLESWSLDDVNVDRIAELAGVAKGTVYIYFRTREELFLEVFDRHHGRWVDALATAIHTRPREPTPDDIAHLVVTTLAERPTLLRLFGVLGSLLGGSVSPQAVRIFLDHRSKRISKIGRVLDQRLPNVTAVEAERWMHRVETFLPGMAPFAHPPPATAAAFELSDSPVLDLDFESELQYIAVTILLSS